jgi:metal-responsive CopG/Arc/MetJ family transcriptional regulator
METIHVVLDKKLLQATDRAARRTKRNRSALIRDALREHLRRLEIRSREERDRAGYSSQRPAREESLVWEAARRFSASDIDEVAGCLKSKRKSKTTSQMDTAIGREVIRRQDRGRY